MNPKRIHSDLEHHLAGARHFRSVQAVKRPEDWRNAHAVEIIDRIIATIPEMPENLQTEYEAAWQADDTVSMDRFYGVMEETARRLGFGYSTADAAAFVERFLAKLKPVETTDDDAFGDDPETAFLSAHAASFTASSHLNGKARISGLSDEDARRQRNEAQATMERLRQIAHA